MRRNMLKRKVTCHVNFTVICWLLEQKQSFRDILQMRSIDPRCHFMDIRFYFSVLRKNFGYAFFRSWRHRSRIPRREAPEKPLLPPSLSLSSAHHFSPLRRVHKERIFWARSWTLIALQMSHLHCILQLFSIMRMNVVSIILRIPYPGSSNLIGSTPRPLWNPQISLISAFPRV